MYPGVSLEIGDLQEDRRRFVPPLFHLERMRSVRGAFSKPDRPLSKAFLAVSKQPEKERERELQDLVGNLNRKEEQEASSAQTAHKRVAMASRNEQEEVNSGLEEGERE